MNTTSPNKTLPEKLGTRFAKSNNKLINRIGNSLLRDKAYPTSYLIRKGAGFAYRMLVSGYHLRKCTSVGKKPRLENKPYLVNNGEIHIGDYVNICSRGVGCDLVSYPGGKLEIGDNVFINFGTTINAQKHVKIGDGVKIGPYCMIHDTDFHIQGDDFTNPEGVPVIIEKGAWLGSRVILMKGSVIGEGSIIAAGSVVSGIIPPNVVAGGMPAKVLKKVNQAKKESNIKDTDVVPDWVEVQINALIAKKFGIKEQNVRPGLNFMEIPGWSAQRHMELIDEIETSFSVKAELNDRVKLGSVLRLYNWVRRQLPQTQTSEDKTRGTGYAV